MEEITPLSETEVTHEREPEMRIDKDQEV